MKKFLIELNGMYLHEFTPNERYEESLRGIQTERYSGAEFDPVFSEDEKWFDPITAAGHLKTLAETERWNGDNTDKKYSVSIKCDD